MQLSTLIVIIVLVLIIIVFVMFPEARALLKGFVRLFVKDMATTPEGAEMIYSEKIDQAQESYNKANNSYRLAEGKLATSKSELEQLNKRLSKVEKDCETLVRDGKMESASLKAEEREEIISSIARQEELVKAFSKAASQAKEAQEITERNLRKLKRESKEVVENMKVKKELQKVYDDMDDLKNTTGTDKMIDSIREKNKDLDSMVEGSRAVHENKLSTKLEKADKDARKAQSDDYLSSLKKKYNK